MTKDEITASVIETVKDVSSRELNQVTLATSVLDVMDSLDHATLVIELNDKFPDAKLIQNENFFKALTVQDLVDVISAKVV
jgi:acyl carrier protein